MALANRSSSRNGATVIWLAVHTSEGGGTARDLRDADWWTGSSHAICDNTELLTPAQGCVPYDRGSWTLRNGNAKSENIEQIGYAKWSRDYWLTSRMPQLQYTARWLRERAAARGIPLDYIGISGVQQNRRGVIQHNDYSKGTGDGTHWDCGPGYPIDVVINMARNSQPIGDDDVSAEEVWSHPISTKAGTKRAVDVLAGLDNDLRADLAWKGQQITDLTAKVDQLLQQAAQ